MTTRACWLLLALIAVPSAARAGETPPQWIVVTAPAFRSAIEPLCELRRGQGMNVVVLQTTDVASARALRAGDAEPLRQKVNQLCRTTRGTSYVLLVGAVEAGHLADADQKVVPPLPGTVGRMKGQPSDNGYGCPGKDLLPSVAVGRLPARSSAEASQMVQKIVAYETNDQPGRWRRQITVLAGVPAFNPLVDKLVESVAMARLGRLDPLWTGHAIYHNPQSRFCVPDDELRAVALRYIQDGQALTLYLGHSNAESFYAGRARFLSRDDWSALAIRSGPGVFATFGCCGCQLTGTDGEGYGVAAIRNPHGPVAVFGSHGICFAAMVQLAADTLTQTLLARQPPERLGDVWLGLKAGLAQGKMDDLTFRLLNAVDGDERIPQAVQRQEHLEMFVLLGDPALLLARLAADVTLTASAAVPGKQVAVQGQVPPRLAGARVVVTLERPASSEPADLQPLPQQPGDQRDRVMLANHDRANRFVLADTETSVRDGRFEVRLPVPVNLPWSRLIVRAYAVKATQEGLAVAVVPVTQAAPSPRRSEPKQTRREPPLHGADHPRIGIYNKIETAGLR